MTELPRSASDVVVDERPAARAGAPLNVAIGLAGLRLGGCQINAVDLARTLRGRGHEVSLFAVRDDAVSVPVEPYAALHGFEIELLDDHGGTRGTARAITRLADARGVDVVHAFAPWLGRIVGLASASWPRGRAAVETNWNMENAFWGSRRVPLIVGTGAMRAQAQDRVSAAYLMEPPVDLDADRPDPAAAASFRATHGIGPDETLVAIVTRVDRAMKGEGILHAIQAIALLDRPGLRLVVVGDGDAFDDVARAAAAANERLGRPAILLTGSMLDPRPAYAAADLVLGMGGSAIRALAHGKPLVVLGEDGFALTYAPETVPHFRQEGFFGHGCETEPVEHLAGLVAGLAGDPVRLDALGAFGLAEAESRFGLDAAAATLEAIYRAAVDGAPTRAARAYEAGRLVARTALSRLRSTVPGGTR